MKIKAFFGISLLPSVQNQEGFRLETPAQASPSTVLAKSCSLRLCRDDSAGVGAAHLVKSHHKRGRVDVCGQRRSHAFREPPPDEIYNGLVTNASIRHQSGYFFSNQYGIRSVGVRCAQSSRTRLERFDFCCRLLLERRSRFHPRLHASL